MRRTVETEGNTEVVKDRFLYCVVILMKEAIMAMNLDAFIYCRMKHVVGKSYVKIEDCEAIQEEEDEEAFDTMK